jgi:hypothetical protein
MTVWPPAAMRVVSLQGKRPMIVMLAYRYLEEL